MEILAHQQLEQGELRMVEGGHMMYQKCITMAETGEAVFIKAHQPELFTSEVAEAHTKRLLQHEAHVYSVLEQLEFPHIPRAAAFENDTLFLTAHMPEDGWHWELPAEPLVAERYIEDVLHALEDLESLPTITSIADPKAPGALDELYARGWNVLQQPEVKEQVLAKLLVYQDSFLPHVETGAIKLIELFRDGNFERYDKIVQEYLQQPREHMGHFDARQSNIAWHPDHNVSLVDWSWASATTLGSDRTMFMIDLFKSGYDIRGYYMQQHLDPAHALLQMGNWLGRSIAPSAPSDDSVRFHQLATAVSAATLLL